MCETLTVSCNNQREDISSVTKCNDY